ncbi:MAG: hypothetical protein RIC51_11255, partial [Erythrobacter sp.]
RAAIIAPAEAAIVAPPPIPAPEIGAPFGPYPAAEGSATIAADLTAEIAPPIPAKVASAIRPAHGPAIRPAHGPAIRPAHGPAIRPAIHPPFRSAFRPAPGAALGSPLCAAVAGSVGAIHASLASALPVEPVGAAFTPADAPLGALFEPVAGWAPGPRPAIARGAACAFPARLHPLGTRALRT